VIPTRRDTTVHHSLLQPTEPDDQGVYDITTLGRPNRPRVWTVDDHLIQYVTNAMTDASHERG
jgi:hypothetical protein